MTDASASVAARLLTSRALRTTKMDSVMTPCSAELPVRSFERLFVIRANGDVPAVEHMLLHLDEALVWADKAISDPFRNAAQGRKDVGLARGYTALGDVKNAIGNWEITLRSVPEDQKANLPIYEQALKALMERNR